MNETLGRGYARIENIRQARGNSCTAHERNHVSPPDDRLSVWYLTLFTAGVGFLLPYNSFIMAVDYFQHHYPGTTIMFDMSTVYIISALFAVLFNNVLVELLSYNIRIYFGHVVSVITMVFVACCNIAWDGFSLSTSYNVNLVAIGIVAFGCTMQQSSYYGFTSMLPPRYTQAVMAGESAAGFWVSIDRIVTKYGVRDEKNSTLAFFFSSITMIGFHCLMHRAMIRSSFVQFYLRLNEESRKKIVLEPTEDAGLIDLDTTDINRASYGVLKLQTSPPDTANSIPVEETNGTALSANATQSTAFSFSNPVYEPSASGMPSINEETVQSVRPPSFKVEEVLVAIPSSASTSSKTWKGIKRGLIARWHVAQAIYPYMVSIGLAYFVTLSLYPGIISEIVSCHFGSWMPIIVMGAFNTADLIGKLVAALPYEWTRSQILMMGSLRLLLIPLLLLCATPRGSPHIQGEVYPITFAVVLGLTNGIVGSIPMIQAPSRVRDEHKEITGNIMTLSYNIGLTAGSLVAYLLDAMLGPPLQNPCSLIYPTPTLLTKPTVPTTAAANVTQRAIETTITILATVARQLNVTSTMFTPTSPITLTPNFDNMTKPSILLH